MLFVVYAAYEYLIASPASKKAKTNDKQQEIKLAERDAMSKQSVEKVTATWNPRDYKYL